VGSKDGHSYSFYYYCGGPRWPDRSLTLLNVSHFYADGDSLVYQPNNSEKGVLSGYLSSINYDCLFILANHWFIPSPIKKSNAESGF